RFSPAIAAAIAPSRPSAPVPQRQAATIGARAAFGIAGRRHYREGLMRRALVVFGALACWPFATLAQTEADPAEAPAHETSVFAEASDTPASDSWLGSVESEQPSVGAAPVTGTGRPARWGSSANIGGGTARGDFSSLLK